jgi:hypothetical protein
MSDVAQSEIDNEVIDAALNSVEGQHVLNQLLEGKPWSKAFGIGGSSVPVYWRGDGRGIEVWSEPRRLITPAQIIARARLYTVTPSNKGQA